MESHILLGFVEILTEALKIFIQNGKLMAFFTSITITLFSIMYLFNFFSYKSVFPNWIFNQSFLLVNTLNSPEYANLVSSLYQDITTREPRKWIFFLISSVISFQFSTSTILASSASAQPGETLSIKDLLLQTCSSTKRSFITLLYITFFIVCYGLLGLLILLRPLMDLSHYPFALQALYIALSVLYSAFYVYLTILWNLALVVSVVEENLYGFEALRFAAKIGENMELYGFLVNLLVTVLCWIVLFRIQGFSKIPFTDFSGFQMILGLILLNCIWLIRMFGLIAYTVLYYQCKKKNGEELR